MEKCDKCGELGHDRRTLYMSCFYDMSELGLPFTQLPVGDRTFFTLRVCKTCRASWMASLCTWFKQPKEERTGSEIFVRHLGANKEL